MRTVRVSEFVALQPAVVERALTPTNVIEYEGTFVPADVTEHDDGTTTVTANARGLEATFQFEPTANGIRYEQVDDTGPFDAMTTEWAFEKEDEGVRVQAESSVSLGLPVSALTDRVAAWKRRKELDRAVDNLVADVS